MDPLLIILSRGSHFSHFSVISQPSWIGWCHFELYKQNKYWKSQIRIESHKYGLKVSNKYWKSQIWIESHEYVSKVTSIGRLDSVRVLSSTGDPGVSSCSLLRSTWQVKFLLRWSHLCISSCSLLRSTWQSKLSQNCHSLLRRTWQPKWSHLCIFSFPLNLD